MSNQITTNFNRYGTNSLIVRVAALFLPLVLSMVTSTAYAYQPVEERSRTSGPIDTLVFNGTNYNCDVDINIGFDSQGAIYISRNSYVFASSGTAIFIVPIGTESSVTDTSSDFYGFTKYRETSESTSSDPKYYTKVEINGCEGTDVISMTGNVDSTITDLDVDLKGDDDELDSDLGLDYRIITAFGTPTRVYLPQAVDIDLQAGNGNDDFYMANSTLDQTFRGGGGSDTYEGGSGDEEIYGSGGNSDRLYGYGGDDTFLMLASDDGDDTVIGGDGEDTVDYSSRIEPVLASFAATNGTMGQSGESDSVKQVELFLTGSGDDVLDFTGSGSDAFEVSVDAGLGLNSVDVFDGGAGDEVICGEGDTTSVTRDSGDSSDGCYNITEDGVLIVENGSPVDPGGSGDGSGSGSGSASGSGSGSGSTDSGSSTGSSTGSGSGSGDGGVVLTTHVPDVPVVTGLLAFKVSKRSQYPLSKKTVVRRKRVKGKTKKVKSRVYRNLTGFVLCDRDGCEAEVSGKLKVKYRVKKGKKSRFKTKMVKLKGVKVRFEKAGKEKFTLKLSGKARKYLKRFSKDIRKKRAKAWVDLTATATADGVSAVVTKTGDTKATTKIPIKTK